MSTKKVLVFAPYGSWLIHHQVDAVLGTALRLRGCEVTVLLCDGLFENCPLAGRPVDPAKCRACSESGRNFFSSFPLEVRQLRTLITAQDTAEARRWADSLEPGGMAGAVFDGMEVGSWTNGTMHAYFLSGSLGELDEEKAGVYRGFLYNAALIVRGMTAAIEKLRPDHLLCFSGINAYYRVAKEVAGKLGLPAVVHERGFIDDSFSILDSSFPSSNKELLEAWEEWRSRPLTAEECRETARYFEEREQGKNSNFIAYYDFTSEAESVRKTLRIPPDAKVVGLFPSSDWEVGISRSTMKLTFGSQIEWIRATARACREEGAYLVIRHHPNNVTKGRIAYPFLDELMAVAGEFPDHVRVIMPDEKVTSYALLWCVDLAVTFFTTMGAEAFVRGVPTICLGDYLYRHMGLEWVRSREAYPDAVKAALRKGGGVGIEELKRAYRFAYYIFFRLPFRFKSFGIRGVHSPDIRIKGMDDLAPGKDPALDAVCSRILDGGDLCPRPGPGRPESAAREEQEFLQAALSKFAARRRELRAIGWTPGGTSDAMVSVIRLQRERNAPGRRSPLLDSLKRARHRRFEDIPVFSPSYRDAVAALDSVGKALGGCRGEFVYLGLDSAQLDESMISTAMDALTGHGDEGPDLCAWGAWISGASGSIRAEVLSERSKDQDFAKLRESHPILKDPFAILSLSLWRKSALVSFLDGLATGGAGSRADLGLHAYERIADGSSGVKRLDLPMTVLRPEEEQMDLPVRDRAWLLDISDKPAEAETAYRQALDEDPDDGLCLLNYARLLGRLGRHEELRRAVEPFLARNCGHAGSVELATLLSEVMSAPAEPSLRAETPAGVATLVQAGDPQESWKPAARRSYGDYSEVAHLVESIPGWLLQGQEKFLFDKVKSLPDGAVILEIGCERGRSTAAMAFACAGTSKRIYSIDTFCGNDGLMKLVKDFIEEWRGNLARHGLAEYVTPVKGYSFDVLKDWKGPAGIDFAFIDASHEYVDVVKDFQLVHPMIKPGGWMAFHDVEPGWPGSWRAWLEYGFVYLDNHEAVATLACGRKKAGMAFDHLNRQHAEFSFSRHYKEYLVKLFNGAAAPITDAMERSLSGPYGTPAEREAMHAAELLIGRMPEDVPFRKTLRNMLGKDARIDGHLLVWNAMTLMAEGKWREAYLDLVEASRVSRPLAVERIRDYCKVLKEKLADGSRSLPEPGAPSLGQVSPDVSGGSPGAGHYGQDYFNWQKHVGAFGGVANLFKFRDFIKPGDTVVDLGSGGGYLLRNLGCARKMGVEINPAARRESSLLGGIDSVERPSDLPDDYADVVVSNHALEHMHSPLDSLRALLPKLKPGGRLVMVVPNDPPQQAWEPEDINKHLFTWNPMTLGNLVSLAGFSVIGVEAIQHQWPPDYQDAFIRLGEEGFHAACREQARRNGNHQIRVVAERPLPDGTPHRFHAARKVLPSAADIPIALMTYKRPEHTAKVLKSLEALGARNLHVFSDGPRTDADREGVERTRGLFRSVPWARLEYEESRENRGLAKSIMHAADRVLDRHEFMILLEDDCVPQRHFLDFMAKCLERYRDDPAVYGISGYTVPLDPALRRAYAHDAYFFPRIGSWGWATWRRAWSQLDRDLAHVYRAVLDAGIDIHQGGNDVRGMVESILQGQPLDAWTLNWILTVYARKGFYVYPVESHVQNIGFDGTGVHCGATAKYDTPAAERAAVSLPDRVEVDPAIAKAFRSFYDMPR